MLAMTPISPLTGRWPYPDFPQRVTLMGRPFLRSLWAWEFYDGVREQYREDVPTQSMHLMVRNDGCWEVSHKDAYNPDWGERSLALHFIFDIVLGAGKGSHHG